MIAPRLFGTDGIRAHAASAILQPQNITRLGRIIARRVKAEFFGALSHKKPCIVIGRDTRVSGAYIEQALLAGINCEGVDGLVLGVLPTAAVANFTRSQGAALGIMISASHNPHYDNGLKVFSPLGFKIDDDKERALELDYFSYDEEAHAVSEQPGCAMVIEGAAENYMATAKAVVDDTINLSGLTIALDSAHGAASVHARHMFESLGAVVHSFGEYAPGRHINLDCGSEAPEKMKKHVLDVQADMGIAFDGDADRVIFVDERGAVIDGDAVLALMAIDRKAQGKLAKNTMVATVMSSMALDHALAPHGINVVRTGVGDKLVARTMQEDGFTFGGENSGHIIIFPHATTGDGLSSALNLLSILKRSHRTASSIFGFFHPTPRLLKNFIVAKKLPLEDMPRTQAALMHASEELNNRGRVMMRYSGTENKARLLVEAESAEECAEIATTIGAIFLDEIEAIAA